MSLSMYSSAVCCCSDVPRKSRSGPTQAQTVPQTRPCLSSSLFTWAGSMWARSSTGISTLWKPHFLKVGKRRGLSLGDGGGDKKVFMPNLLIETFRQANKIEATVQRILGAGDS